MTATSVAPGAQAGQLSADEWIARTGASLEFFRCDSTIAALQECYEPNVRLIEWFRGRRAVLAKELGL